MIEPKKRILLVEDEPHLAFNMNFNLQAEGYDVVPAVDGQIALQKFAHEGPFDLIILDVMLPEVNGFEVAKNIREHDDQTQILMLTALGKEDDRLRGFEAGADDYVTKPFHLQEFLLRVKRMIKRSQYFHTPTDTSSAEVLRYGPFALNTELLHLVTPTGQHTLTALEADVLARVPFSHVSGWGTERIYNTSNIAFEGLEAEAILILLSEAGVCASSGAACSSGSLEPSHVLKAMGIEDRIAHGAIRFSLSRFNAREEIDHVVSILPGLLSRLTVLSTR